jgi:hypothetical protein
MIGSNIKSAALMGIAITGISYAGLYYFSNIESDIKMKGTSDKNVMDIIGDNWFFKYFMLGGESDKAKVVPSKQGVKTGVYESLKTPHHL